MEDSPKEQDFQDFTKEDFSKDVSPLLPYRVGDILFVKKSIGFEGKLEKEIFHHACVVSLVDQNGGFLEAYHFDPSLGEKPSPMVIVRKATKFYKGKPKQLLPHDFKEFFKVRGIDHVVHAKGPQDPNEINEMLLRLESVKEQEFTYDLLNYNCQHFAYYVRYGKAECPELNLLKKSMWKGVKSWNNSRDNFWLKKLGPWPAVLIGAASSGSFYLKNVTQEDRGIEEDESSDSKSDGEQKKEKKKDKKKEKKDKKKDKKKEKKEEKKEKKEEKKEKKEEKKEKKKEDEKRKKEEKKMKEEKKKEEKKQKKEEEKRKKEEKKNK